MAWVTVASHNYTSLERNTGDGYYAFIYKSPDRMEMAVETVFLHKDAQEARKLYAFVVRVVEASRKVFGSHLT